MCRTRFWEFPIGDELVVARPDVHGLFLLNSTARLIWTEARHNVPPEDIAASLADVYGIPLHQALRDVNAVLESTTVPPAPAPWTPVPSGPTPTRHRYYRLHGKTFEISTDSPELEDEIRPRLESLQVDPSPADFHLALFDTAEAFTLWHGPECLAAEDSVAAMRARLLQEMVRLSEPDRQWLALLHAGACAIDARCVIFPAGSHSGKTTLAAILMRHGFSLLSDDFVGLERGSLRIPPMPFALAVREGSWPVLSRHYPDLLGRPTVDRFGEQVKFLPPSPVASGPRSRRSHCRQHLDPRQQYVARTALAFRNTRRAQGKRLLGGAPAAYYQSIPRLATVRAVLSSRLL